jgi:hypothetical protein
MPSFMMKSEHPKNFNGIRNSFREDDIFLIETRPFPTFLSVIEDAEKTSEANVLRKAKVGQMRSYRLVTSKILHKIF